MRLTTIVRTVDFTGPVSQYAPAGFQNTGWPVVRDNWMLRLRETALGLHSTTSIAAATTQWVGTGLLTANDLRGLTGFQVKVHHIKVNRVQVTQVRFKLAATDFAAPFYWNGSAWVPETDGSHWNTEDEVSDHIATFAQGLTAKAVGVLIQLTTTDARYTPLVEWVKVGLLVDTLSFQDDLMYSLAKSMSDAIQLETEFMYTMPATGTTVDVAAVIAASGLAGFTPAGLDTVRDPAGVDPEANLNSGAHTGTVWTLTQSVPAGHQLKLRIPASVDVVMEATDVDFVEVRKLPQVLLTNPRQVEGSENPVGDSVTHKAAGTADMVKPPMRVTLAFDLRLDAHSSTDLRRLMQSVTEYIQDHPVIAALSHGESYRLWLRGKFQRNGAPDLTGIASAQAVLEVENVLIYRSGQSTKPLVKRTNTTIVSNGDTEVAVATGADAPNVPLGDPPN